MSTQDQPGPSFPQKPFPAGAPQTPPEAPPKPPGLPSPSGGVGTPPPPHQSPPSPPQRIQTFTPTSSSKKRPAWHKFVFPILVFLILGGGLTLGVYLMSRPEETQEIRAPAEVSPPRADCGLEVTTSETVAPGRYTINVNVAYTGSQDSAELTYFWARCRCREGGGNRTQGGKPICKAYWPTDPGECSIGSQQTITLTRNTPVSLSQTVSQHENMDCGSYQIDLVVVDVAGEVCNQFVPSYGFYPTGVDCELPTPTPIATPTPTATPKPTPTATPTQAPKKQCYQDCAQDDDCEGSLACRDSKCVNPDCPDELDCACPGATPTPTPTGGAPKVEKPAELPGASSGLGILNTIIHYLKSLLPQF